MPAFAIEQTPSTFAADRREAGLVLRPLRGPSESPLIPLSSGRHVIGSGPDADVRLEIPGVEPQHAVLLVGPSRSVLKAFSRFTWVNDGVVRECVLKPGDRLCIGPLEFEVLKGKGRRREARVVVGEPVVNPHSRSLRASRRLLRILRLQFRWNMRGAVASRSSVN